MDKTEKHVTWFILNFVWWLVSISAGYGNGVDFNPLFTNLGEVLLNVSVWIAGHGLIITYGEKRANHTEVQVEEDKEEEA